MAAPVKPTKPHDIAAWLELYCIVPSAKIDADIDINNEATPVTKQL
jgi:hypothetical protein